MSENPYEPPAVPQQSPPPQQPPPPVPMAHPDSDATGGVIPYKNPPALIGYYFGIFSLIPALGLILGLVGFILGLVGWSKYRKNPVIKGHVHAWIGIIVGGLSFFGHVTVIILLVIAANQN